MQKFEIIETYHGEDGKSYSHFLGTLPELIETLNKRYNNRLLKRRDGTQREIATAHALCWTLNNIQPGPISYAFSYLPN